MAAASLERHHEPAYLAEPRVPTRIRIPGFALRIRIPGPPLQRRLAPAVLAAGLAIAGASTAGLLSSGHSRYVADTAPASAPVPRGQWVAAPPVTAAHHVSPPVFLTIPAIGVAAPLTRLGLTVSGALQVPPTTTVAGWYSQSPRPGAVGSAVIGGHVDSFVGPGVFYRLHLLRPGDRIYIRQASRRLAVFRVSSVRHYAKDRFPTRAVYGPVPTPQLRLITCGGTFDPATGSYLSNVVVYATLIT